MFGAVVMFDDEFIHIVSISFTALILTELIMVALTVRTWHWAMIAAEVLSLAIYLVSVIIFPQSFGKFKCQSLKYDFLASTSALQIGCIYLTGLFLRYRSAVYVELDFHLESCRYHRCIVCSIIHS